MSTYNFTLAITAYDAGSQGTLRKHFEWKRSTMGVQCVSPQDPVYRIAPGATQNIFSGIRATSLDNTTQLTLTLSPLASNRYRFTWTGGTNPVFRANRNLTLNTHTVTVVVASNGTANFTSSSAGDFTTVQIADTLFIPGVSTGDPAGPFDELNVGTWTVIGKDNTSTTLYLQRLPDTVFQALAQTVTITNNNQIQAFTSTGLSVDDKVDITAGFSAPVQQTYLVDTVTANWFEVLATGPLPSFQVAVPTTTGIQFYTSSKKFVYLELDQEAIVRFNGDTSNTGRVSPLDPGMPEGVGWIGKSGPVWQLDVVNRSTETMNVVVISVE